MTKYPHLAQSNLYRLLQRRGVSHRAIKAKVLFSKRITLLSSLLETQQLLSVTQTFRKVNERRFKTKITSTLLRRKQRRYKKLTYLFLKAHRLRWLRKVSLTVRKAKTVGTKKLVTTIAATATKIRLSSSRKSIFWIKGGAVVPRWKGLQQVKMTLAHNVSLSQRRLRTRCTIARMARLLRRARRFPSTRPPVRRYRGKLKMRKLKLRRGRRTRLLLRRKHYRKYRKLRRVAGKRVTVRNRRAILFAKSRPIRHHLYYKRLLLTQRIGVAVQQLRGLRDTRPQDIHRKQLRRAATIARHWHSELVHLTPSAPRAVVLTKRVKRGVNVKKRVLVATKKMLPVVTRKRPAAPGKKKGAAPAKKLQTSKVKGVNKITVKARKLTHAKGKKAVTLRKSRKAKLFVTRKRMQALVRRAITEFDSGNKYKKLLATAKYRIRRSIYTSMPPLARGVSSGTSQLAKQWRIQPYNVITLRRKLHKMVSSDKSVAFRTALTRVELKLRTLKTRLASIRRASQVKRILSTIKRSLTFYSKRLYRVKQLATLAKKLSSKQKPITQLRNVSFADEQHLQLTPGLRTLAGRQLLIHRYNLASHFPRTHLYDPRPRVLYAVGRQFIRKTLRYKRRLAKRARAIVPKSKRKLRRRTRKKLVVIRKRTYSYTDRSPIHAGRTVPWRKLAKHRGQFYNKLISTRSTFKKLLSTESVGAAAFRQKRAEQIGRTLLWTFLHLAEKVQSTDKNSLLVSRLRTVIRLFLRRKSLPTAAGMRLLILKMFAFSIVESKVQKKQVLALEHRWLLACNLRCAAISARIGLKMLAHRYFRSTSQPKQGRSRNFLPPVLLRRHVSVLSKIVHRTNRFTLAYPKKVKRLLRKRNFTALIKRLRPRRWYPKKVRIRLRKRRAATHRSWRRIRSYRKARRFTIRFISRRLRTGIRRGERHAIHLRSIQPRQIFRQRKLQQKTPPHSNTLRPVLKWAIDMGFIKGPLYEPKQEVVSNRIKKVLHLLKNSSHRRTLLQLRNKKTTTLTRSDSRKLFAPLDSIRLRAKKALLWKAPLQAVPVSSADVLSLAQGKQLENWYSYPATNQKASVKLGHQELRRPFRAVGSTLPTQPLAPTIPTNGWRATRINRRYSISEVFSGIFKRRAVTALYKKPKLQGRRSKIARIAAHPRITAFWFKKTRVYKKERKAKRNNLLHLQPLRIRAIRSRPFRRGLLFRKKYLFMRRLSTRGWKELPKGKRLRPRGISIVTRPLMARLRRSKPLRRSLRRQLALQRRQGNKPIYKKVQTSTGRVFSTLRPKPRRRRRYWQRIANRAEYYATNKKLQVVDQLLKQFDYLSVASPLASRPTCKAVVATTKGLRRTPRKAVSPLRSLMRTQRRFNVINHQRSRITGRTRITVRKTVTLNTGRRITVRSYKYITTTRRRVELPLVPTVKRGKWRVKAEPSAFLRTFREVNFSSLYPTLTPGKVERYLRLERRGRFFRSRMRLRISLRRGRLLGARVYPASKLRTTKVCRKLTRVRVLGKRVRCAVRIAQAKAVKNKKLPTHASKACLWIKAVIANEKKRKYLRQIHRNKRNLRRRTIRGQTNNGTKPWANRTNNNKPYSKGVGRASSSTEIKSQTVTKFVPPSKQRFSITPQIHEPVLSPALAKKITSFNKEGNAQTEKAYNALMSGLKASWTQLQDDSSTVPLAQREADAEIMEKLYTEHYMPVIRFNPKAVLDFKRYKAAQATIAQATTQKK